MADITAAQYDSFVSDWVSSNGGTIPSGGNGATGGVKANAAAAKEQGGKIFEGKKLSEVRSLQDFIRAAADKAIAQQGKYSSLADAAYQIAAAPVSWDNVGDVIQGQANRAKAFIDKYETSFGEGGSGYTPEGAQSWQNYGQQTEKAVKARNDEIRTFLQKNQQNIQPDSYTEAMSGLDEVERTVGSWNIPYLSMLQQSTPEAVTGLPTKGNGWRVPTGGLKLGSAALPPGISAPESDEGTIRYQERQSTIAAARAEYSAALQRLSDVDDKLTWGSSAFTPEEWEQLKQLRIDYSKQVQDAKAAMTQAEKAEDWEGRDELIQEYKQLQKEWLTAVQSATTPEEIREAEALGLQMQQVNEALQAGDRAAGNGERVYTWRDRAGNVLVGTAAGIVGSIGNAAVTMADATLENRAYGDTEARLMDEQLDLNRAQLEQANRENPEFAVLSLPQGETEAEKRQRKIEAYEDPDRQAKWDRMYAWADTISESGQRDIQRAKEGLSQLGQIGVDIAQNMLEMGFDAGVGAITGGGSLASMFVRTFGQGHHRSGNRENVRRRGEDLRSGRRRRGGGGVDPEAGRQPDRPQLPAHDRRGSGRGLRGSGQRSAEPAGGKAL